MIEYIHIENFRAFKEETLILGDHTLFIGTHSSGKTTALKALDAFFNHAFDIAHIRNKQKPFVVEISLNQRRYKKVFKPPYYHLDQTASKGDFSKLSNYRYLYLPNPPVPWTTYINQVIGLHYTPNLDDLQNHLPKNLIEIIDQKAPSLAKLSLQMALKTRKIKTGKALKKARFEYLQTPRDKHVLLGVDHIEQTFLFEDLDALIKKTTQIFIVSKQKQFINAFSHHIHPLYRQEIKKEVDTITTPLKRTKNKPFILVEGKTDVPWFEAALKHLNRYQNYRVMPCGGHGNIQYVDAQLKKAGYKTLIITDGDVNLNGAYSLSKDIIEQYADITYINQRFHTNLTSMPKDKKQFFKAINDDPARVKHLISAYPMHHFANDNALISELDTILKDYETNQGGHHL